MECMHNILLNMVKFWPLEKLFRTVEIIEGSSLEVDSLDVVLIEFLDAKGKAKKSVACVFHPIQVDAQCCLQDFFRPFLQFQDLSKYTYGLAFWTIFSHLEM